MSVLSFPRIYFRGFMQWNPATGNNNDYFPTYDDVQSALSWEFLEAHTPVTRQNFQQTFVPWAIRQQTITYEIPNAGGGSQPTTQTGIPAEWNFYGGNDAAFVQYQDKTSDVTGGAVAPGEAATDDPLIGTPVALVGNPFGNPDAPTPGRLVDDNPVSVYSSQIFFQELRIGDERVGLVGQRANRMQSRFINFTRNFNLGAAGGASVTWQTCFPTGDGLKITPGGSDLLKALAAALGEPGVQGVMVRFNAYLNLYNQNGFFNGISPSPANKNADMTFYYEQVEKGLIPPFSNPCYSRIVGVVGIWRDNELATVPNGRYLVPEAALLTPEPKGAGGRSLAEVRSAMSFAAVVEEDPGVVASAAAEKPPAGPGIRIPPAVPKKAAQLGATLVEVDYDRSSLRIDLMNTFPEVYWQGAKADFGPIEIGVLDDRQQFTQVAELSYGQYDEDSYKATAGLVDLPFDPQHAQAIKQGTLCFQVPQSVGTDPPSDKRILVEQPLTAQSDRRSDYLDQNGKLSIPVGLRLKGEAAPGAQVLVARYNPPDGLMGYSDGSSGLVVAADAKAQVVTIANGTRKTLTLQIPGSSETIETVVNILTADAQGNLTLELEAASPGFPILGLFPFAADGEEPTPPAGYGEQPQPGVAPSSIATGYFATLRVLPFDDAMVGEFVDLWNRYYEQADAPEIAWRYIYGKILYVYDQLFPVMRRFLPLDDRTRVEGGIDQVLALISDRFFHESTLAMPITRDLSAGKRRVLELWGNLVRRKYPKQPISKP